MCRHHSVKGELNDPLSILTYTRRHSQFCQLREGIKDAGRQGRQIIVTENPYGKSETQGQSHLKHPHECTYSSVIAVSGAKMPAGRVVRSLLLRSLKALEKRGGEEKPGTRRCGYRSWSRSTAWSNVLRYARGLTPQNETDRNPVLIYVGTTL